MRHGDVWLKTDLCQASLAAMRAKRSTLHAQFHRIRSRRGVKKANVAVAASILTSAFHMLRTGTPYADLGPDHVERRNADRTAKRLAKRIEALGYHVELKPAA